jgi:hypothetical protein
MYFQPFLKNLRLVLVVLVLVAIIQGCTLIRAVFVYTHSPDNLSRVSATLPIYAEKGAEPLSDEISAALLTTIQQIETTHGGKLNPLPPVVLCATETCYEHYAAIPGSAAETLYDKRISLNGEKICNEKRDAVQLFTHELSHYYWFSQGVIFQPRWFEEGMGVWASHGGGAERVSVQDAEQAILNGTTIHPTLNAGIWNYITQSPSAPGNDWHMFYRQSGMFIQYLHDHDPAAFASLLDALRRTKDLRSAWTIAYKKSVDELWGKFIKEIQSVNTK